MRFVGLALALSFFVVTAANGNPPTTAPAQEFDLRRLAREVERVGRQAYPKAACVVSGDRIYFEFDARDFMVHEPLKTGEWQEAVIERGPKRHGIVGDIELFKGAYNGAAELPQTLDKRYFTLAVSAPYSKQLDAHLHVGVKYPAEVPAGFKAQLEQVLNDFESYVAKRAE